MRILERLEKQAELIDELTKELEKETSYRGVERLVQLIIQALLDLGLMTIAITGNRRPKAYSEIGPLLHDTGILSQEDAKLLRSMAGMRNILVHAYAIIDRDKVLQAAKRLRHDAPRISSTILSGLRKRNVDPEEYKYPKSLIDALTHPKG